MKGSRKRLWKLKPEICRLFKESELTLQQITDYVGGTPKHTQNVIGKNFSRKERIVRKKKNYSRSRIGKNNPMYGKKGKNSPSYKTGKCVRKGKRTLVLKPDWYTGRKGSNYIYEHSYIYCLWNLLTEIPAGYCIHHKDQIKNNNDITNLQMMTLGDHVRLHARLKRKCRDYSVSEVGVK